MTGEQALAALPVIGVVVVAWWGHKQSKRTAEDTVKSGVAVEERMGMAQIQAAMEALVNTYQEDTEAFRAQIRYGNEQLDACAKTREELRRELARMYRKHGENGLEIGI